jgi:class 3 adenylate cyclase/CHASE3 domain sensor protein
MPDDKAALTVEALDKPAEPAGRHRFLARELRLFERLNRPVTNFVARLPFRLEGKLLVAFLGAVALLVLLGGAGLAVLAENGRRTEALIVTQQRAAAYRDLEHDAHSLLITVSSALWLPGTMVAPMKTQIGHLQAGLVRLRPVSDDEAAQVEEIRQEYASFVDLAKRQLDLLSKGDVDHAGELLTGQVLPQAAKIEALTERLVEAADARMAAAIDATHAAYRASRDGLIAFIVVAALFGVYFAHTISAFVVGSLREIGGRLGQIAQGEFGQRVAVPNRDEIGDLADNVNRASAQLDQLYTALEMEKERSEEMLYHTLPRPIVARLRGGEQLIADRVAEATILFSDLAGFTQLSDHLAPEEVLDVLDVLFSRYDAIAARLGLEKIKTIGDGYMVAGGVLEPCPDHAAAVAEMALAMRAATDIATRALGVLGQPLRVRIGINSGPLVAGILGSVKMVYDVWGDTVNTASRMEKYGEPGRVAVSAATRDLLGNQFRFEARAPIEVKGKGAMETYFLERRIGPRTFHNMMRRAAAARAKV